MPGKGRGALSERDDPSAPIKGHPLNTPPVDFSTLATIRLVRASKSSSVSVRSAGWMATSMAMDFLSSPSDAPSKT
jgi:hypothetical protein